MHILLLRSLPHPEKVGILRSHAAQRDENARACFAEIYLNFNLKAYISQLFELFGIFS